MVGAACVLLATSPKGMRRPLEAAPSEHTSSPPSAADAGRLAAISDGLA